MKYLLSYLLLFFSAVAFSQPTLLTSNTSASSTSTSTSLTSTPSGTLLVAVVTQSDGTDVSIGTISSTPTLTWTVRAQARAGTISGTVMIYTAVTTATGATTVNVSWPGGNAITTRVYAFSDYNTSLEASGVTDNNMDVPSISITTPGAAYIVGASSDWNAIDGTSRSYESFTLEDYYRNASGVYTSYHFHRSVGSASTYTVGLVSPGGQSAGVAAYAIVQAGASNVAPTADAGVNQLQFAGATASVLDGRGSTDSDGSISSYAWTQLTGPNSSTISSPSASVSVISGLVPGTYTYKLVVTDDGSATDADTVSVTIPTIATAGNTTLTHTELPFSSIDLVSAGRGAEHWLQLSAFNGSSPNGIKLPDPSVTSYSSDLYYRINWAQLEGATQYSYDWTIFDIVAHFCIDHGIRMNFGILPMCEGYSPFGTPGGANLSYPTWVHTAMQSEGVTDWIYSGDPCWVPNWNSPTWINALDSLYSAVYNHIMTTSYTPGSGPHAGESIPYSDIIGYTDIRGYGNFGEWHNYPWESPDQSLVPAGAVATSATLKAIIDLHTKYFWHWPFMALWGVWNTGVSSWVPADVGYYVAMKSNADTLIGWRRDDWGWASRDPEMTGISTVYSGVAFDSVLLNKYKSGPVGGEPRTSSDDSPVPYASFPYEVQLWHATSFGNGNFSSPYSSSQQRDSIRLASKYSGYRIYIQSTEMATTPAVSDGLHINQLWTNAGVAPPYYKWDLHVVLRDAGNAVKHDWLIDWSPHMFQPGDYTLDTTLTLNSSDTCTGCSLEVIVKDPNDYSQPMSLYFTDPTRNSDGSYTIRSSFDIVEQSVSTEPRPMSIRKRFKMSN